MDVEKWFNEQNIESVQDRKDGMDYWKNYELYTWNDVIECLEAMKEACEGKPDNTSENSLHKHIVSKAKRAVCPLCRSNKYTYTINPSSWNCPDCGFSG